MMDRTFEDGTESYDVDLFTGIEIEHSPAHGLKTLFVVGCEHDGQDVVQAALNNDCEHIYLGANMSFQVYEPWDEEYMLLNEHWYRIISACLASGLWVTLDFEPKYSHAITNTTFPENEKFISMMSCRMPNVYAYGANACVKIDDVDFKATNPGVWVHPLADLLDSDKMTTWDQYTKDEPLNG